MADDVIVGFCLDESGSMEMGVDVTCAGFNKLIEEQAALPGHAYLTLVLFSSSPVVRFNAGDMGLVDPLGTGSNKYTPAGGTALYDGVLTTISTVEDWLASNPSFVGQVIVVILTDGAENSSKHGLDEVNRRIADKRENESWEFVFMGSGGAAWTEGTKMSAVPASTQVAYASNDMSAPVYAGVSSSMTAARVGSSSFAKAMSDNFSLDNSVPKQDDDEDKGTDASPQTRWK